MSGLYILIRIFIEVNIHSAVQYVVLIHHVVFCFCRIEHEKQRSPDAQAAVRNLVLMIASLCMCGYSELRLNQNPTSSLFQMQGFQMPQTSSRGTCVRNIHAFQVIFYDL